MWFIGRVYLAVRAQGIDSTQTTDGCRRIDLHHLARINRFVERPQKAGLEFRGADDDVRLHAINGLGE